MNVSINTLKLPKKVEDMCCERSPDGWLCSLEKPHNGHYHVACIAYAGVRKPDGKVCDASGLAILAVWDHA